MIHIQNLVNDWPEALDINVLGPDFQPLVKAFSGDRLVTARTVNPNCRTILRYHYTPRQHFGGDFGANKAKARAFFSCFIDPTFRKDYAPYTDYIEEWNEYLAPSLTDAEMGDRILWAKAVAEVWKIEYRSQVDYAHIRLIMCNTAIGNDIPRVFAEIADEYDCVMGYHPYTKWVRGVRDPGDFRWLSGRWEQMEKAWGIKPDWALTECGPYQGPDDGWLSRECLSGDLDKYIEAMRLWIRDLAQTDAYQEGRLLGFTPFTTGPTPQWVKFRTDQPALNRLRDMYAVEWKPGTVPPPVEPPEPGTIVYSLMTPCVATYLNVRSSPGITGDIVGRLWKGSQLRPTGHAHSNDEDVWVQWGDLGWSAEWYNGRAYLIPVPQPSDNDPREV